ncbi:hypothetical protein LIER_24296 [Lithospermum erythrorhizon]|uniref:Uncharacterized protein n=1 Tax=Lithospermum erythrorhizon TaxID=34254 RepID=A0AAV3R6C5_LITER
MRPRLKGTDYLSRKNSNRSQSYWLLQIEIGVRQTNSDRRICPNGRNRSSDFAGFAEVAAGSVLQRRRPELLENFADRICILAPELENHGT